MSPINTELMESRKTRNLHAIRVEIGRGTTAISQSQPSETIIVVLEGVWRFRLPGGVVILNRDEVLRIPAHQRYSSEALADTIALRIVATSQDTYQPGVAHEDPDQYLWGV